MTQPLPKALELAADLCFAACAVREAGASGKRPLLIEEMLRRAEALRGELEPRGDALFHAGVHRSRRAVQGLVLAVEDWHWSGADPDPDDPAWGCVAAAIRRTGQLIGLDAPARKASPPPIGAATHSISKTG